MAGPACASAYCNDVAISESVPWAPGTVGTLGTPMAGRRKHGIQVTGLPFADLLAAEMEARSLRSRNEITL
jgi:hypothetical protein